MLYNPFILIDNIAIFESTFLDAETDEIDCNGYVFFNVNDNNRTKEYLYCEIGSGLQACIHNFSGCFEEFSIKNSDNIKICVLENNEIGDE